MTELGMRELKENFGYFVSLLKKGEPVTLNYRGKALGLVKSLIKKSKREAYPEQKLIQQLEKRGLVGGGSGRVRQGWKAIRVKGRPASDLVIESRE